MSIVKINFLVKKDSGTSRSWKVFITKRLPVSLVGKKGPKQVHICYITEDEFGSISIDHKNKIEQKLKAKWKDIFGSDDVQVDWADAERKFIEKVELTPRKLKRIDSDVLYALHQIKTNPRWKETKDKITISILSAVSGYSENMTEKSLDRLKDKNYLVISGSLFYEVTKSGYAYLRGQYPHDFPYKTEE